MSNHIFKPNRCPLGHGLHPNQPWFVLNAATHYQRVGSQDPAISHFYHFEADESQHHTLAVPDGCVDIIFDCDTARPSARVCGTTFEARSAHLKHGHRYFGIRFAIGLMPECLDISAHELVDQEIDLTYLAPSAGPLIEQIVGMASCREQVALAEAFFSGTAVRKASALTSQAVQLIWQHQGSIRVDDIESITGYTRRTLLRRFIADVGMSPKAFCRIVRCQLAVHHMSHGNSFALSQLACELGFSDQAHFQREFKQLVSTTPLDYRRRLDTGAYLQRIQHVQ
ncbi:MAG: helix-turn-helix domain-containing protein [Pseudomonadota bacterium]